MATFLYRCPVTGYRVQGFVASEPNQNEDDVFWPVTCAVCAQVHLVNPKTGQTLGTKD